MYVHVYVCVCLNFIDHFVPFNTLAALGLYCDKWAQWLWPVGFLVAAKALNCPKTYGTQFP